MDSPCPFCGGETLHRFSHWTTSSFDYRSMVEVRKIQCVACHAEAPERIWNTRARELAS
jgi:hypothetical protein